MKEELMRPRLDAVVIIVRAALTLGVTCLGILWGSGEDERDRGGCGWGGIPMGRDWVVYMSLSTSKCVPCFNIHVSIEKNTYRYLFKLNKYKLPLLVEQIK